MAYTLRWSHFQANIVDCFKHLKDEPNFSDVVLVTEQKSAYAHKMVISTCSPYFKDLLEKNPAERPIIILKDIPFNHLQYILEFMYTGQVNVPQDSFNAFMKSAEALEIKGLAEWANKDPAAKLEFKFDP